MKSYVSEDWHNHFLNPDTPGSTGKILFADIHRSQQSSSLKQLLHKNKTVLINILGGAASRVQPLDVVIIKPFKNHVQKIFEKHIDENLDAYVEHYYISMCWRNIICCKKVSFNN